MSVGEIAVLCSAKALIQKQGWVRGKLCSADGFCIAGAIFAVTNDWKIRDAALDAIRAEVRAQYVVQWNDRAARNKKAALATIERAIKRASRKPKLRRRVRERGSIYA